MVLILFRLRSSGDCLVINEALTSPILCETSVIRDRIWGVMVYGGLN